MQCVIQNSLLHYNSKSRLFKLVVQTIQNGLHPREPKLFEICSLRSQIDLETSLCVLWESQGMSWTINLDSPSSISFCVYKAISLYIVQSGWPIVHLTSHYVCIRL